MASKLRHKVTGDGRTVYLFGATEDLTDFFPTAEPVTEEDAVLTTVTFSGGTRRRFPGGPTTDYSGGTREVVTGRPPTQATLPGYPVKCEKTIEIAGVQVKRVKQFTLQGSFAALHEIAKATALQSYVLRSPNGEPKSIGEEALPT
jgi:hypothetical protein